MTNMEFTKVYSVAVMLPCRWTDRPTDRHDDANTV